jgi:hypothetical protein
MKIQPGHSLTFIFSRVNVSERVWKDLMASLGKYSGEYQRLAFNGVQMTNPISKTLFSSLKHMRCYRALEIFELDQIDARNCPTDRICKAVSGLLKHCRFISSLSLSNALQPLALQLQCFGNGDALTELVVVKQDLTQAFINVDFPARLYLLDFSRSTFTFGALQSLLQILTRPRKPISLVLSDISMPDPHWPSLYEALDTFPRVQCLSSIDWSGNNLPASGIEPFIRFFLEGGPIKFLAINRIFKTSRLQDLEQLLTKIPTTLWGLSLGGSAECNFSGSMKHVLNYLGSLESIRILHLDGQKFSETDLSQLQTYLSLHRSIAEISFDDTAIFSETILAEAYQVIQGSKIPCIGRPVLDFQRFQSRPGFSVKALENLRNVFEKLVPASDSRARACYLHYNREFNATAYQQFLLKFPTYTLKPESVLAPIPRPSDARPFKSLFQMRATGKFQLLNELHVQFLSDPFSPPTWASHDAAQADDATSDDVNRRTFHGGGALGQQGNLTARSGSIMRQFSPPAFGSGTSPPQVAALPPVASAIPQGPSPVGPGSPPIGPSIGSPPIPQGLPSSPPGPSFGAPPVPQAPPLVARGPPSIPQGPPAVIAAPAISPGLPSFPGFQPPSGGRPPSVANIGPPPGNFAPPGIQTPAFQPPSAQSAIQPPAIQPPTIQQPVAPKAPVKTGPPPVRLDTCELEAIDMVAMPDDSVQISSVDVAVPSGCPMTQIEMVAREEPSMG